MTIAIWPPPGEWSGESLDDIDAAIFSSLFSDGRVTFEELPAGATIRRGWWGDTFPEVRGDKWGSKLWLAERAKLTTDPNVPGVSTSKLRRWATDSLQWMIDDGVVVSLEVETEIVLGEARLGITTVRERGDDPRTYFYDALWAAKLAA